MSVTRVKPCAKAPSTLESTRAFAKVFVREAYVERKSFGCAQSGYKYHRHDRTDYHQNTMERPRSLDPTECKYAIRHQKGTDNPQSNAFEYSNSFNSFDDIQKRRLLETKQLPV